MDGEPLQRTDPKLTALVLQGRAEGRRQAFAEAAEHIRMQMKHWPWMSELNELVEEFEARAKEE